MTLAIKTGSNGNYYTIGDKHYDEHFPINWAIQDLTEYTIDGNSLLCGPQHCENCDYYGSVLGVFVGYCRTCSTVAFSGTRGGQYWDITTAEDLDLLPYMNDVNINQIGCITLIDYEIEIIEDEIVENVVILE